MVLDLEGRELDDEISPRDDAPVDDSQLVDADDLEAETSPRARGNSQTLVAILLAVVVLLVAVVGYLVVSRVIEGNGPKTLAGRKIEQYSAQIKDDPRNFMAYFQLTEVYYAQGRYDKALDTIADMRSQEPTGSVLAQAMLGEAKIRDTMGDSDQAVQLLLDSLDVKELAEVHYALAEIYSKRSEWSDAISQYEKYLGFEPGDAGAAVHLAEAYEKIGENDKALGAYQQAATYLPDDPDIAASIQRLGGQ